MKKVKGMLLLMALGLSLTGCGTPGETGPQGPIGPEGPVGPAGPIGETGKDGQTPHIGTNGNWWIGDTDTGVSASGPKGDTGDTGLKGDTGSKGEDGKDGTSMLTGNGAPTASLGKEGDSYIDLDTWDYYVKTADGWTKKGNIKGEDGEDHKQEVHTVTFETSGGTVIASQEVKHGEKIKKPANPVKDGNTFLGWEYMDEAWSFAGHVVTEDMTLVAQWDYSIDSINKVITSAAGAELSVTQYGSTTNTSLLWGEDENGRTHLQTTVESWSGNTVNTYFAFDASGKPYSYKVTNGTISKNNVTLTAESLNGPSVYLDGTQYFGAQGLLNYLSSIYKLNNNKGNYTRDNTIYAEYLVDSYGSKNLTQIQADLIYNDGTLEGVTINYRTVYQYELVQDIEFGVWYPSDSCSTKFNEYKYTYNYGDSTLVLPYDMNDFYYESFDIINTLDQAITEVRLENGASTSLRLANGLPATASYQFDTPTCKVVEGSTGNVTTSFNTYNGTLSITGTQIGSVTLEISTKNVKKTITIDVVEPAVAGINMKTYTAPTTAGGYYSAAAVNGPVTILEKQSILLGAQITPNGAAQDYTLEADSENVKISLEAEDAKTYGLSYQVINVEIYKVTVDQPGTYTLTATSTKNPSIKGTITLNVEALPTVSDVVANDYWHYYGGNGRAIDENIFISFEPSATDDSVGKVTIKDSFTNKADTSIPEDQKVITLVHDYSYNAETNIFTLSTNGVNETYYLKVTADFTGVQILDANEESGIAIAGFTAKVYDPTVYLVAEWYEDKPRPLGDVMIMLKTNGRGDWNNELSFTYTATINDDGSISVEIASNNLRQICNGMGLDSITSLVLDASYETLTLTYVEGGVTKTTTFSNGF
jgi:hypothetical protein